MTATILSDIEGIETKRRIKMTVTLNQILAMENVLATRKIPSDIEAMAKAKRYSNSKQKEITLGDQPLHYVLRILAKEGL